MTPGIILLKIVSRYCGYYCRWIDSDCQGHAFAVFSRQPARAIITNMKLFNGEHGCSTCEDPGDNTRGSSALNRLWPFQEVNVIRTKQMVYTAITKATEQKQAVCSCMYVYIHILLTRSRF